MSITGLHVFDRAVDRANVWLNALMDEMGWNDRHHAYLALRAVLHALRDRLTPDEAAHLGAELPMVIRGFYYEGWSPSAAPSKERTKKQFLSAVRGGLPEVVRLDPEAITRGVFRLLADIVSQGEIEDVRGMLPQEIADLWP